MTHDLIEQAKKYATWKHTGQKRKYTGEDYIVHPTEVAATVASLPDSTPEMIAAAYLHDVVEDTDTSVTDILEEFGMVVASYVNGLTDVSSPEHGNRACRKAKDREWLENQCKEVQTIKMADLISNSSSIFEYDKKFAKVYLKEVEQLHSVLTEADKGLSEKVRLILENYKNEL